MKEKREIRTLSPKLDIVFQALFGEIGSEKITKGFLETILDRKIEKIDLNKNPILRREFKDDKLGILDILAELDGKENCNIELQLVDRKNIIERILYYWSRLYSRQIKQGEEYETLEKAIVILIANFEIVNLEELEYHSTWKIMETNSAKKIILTNKFEIDIIELPKIKGKEDSKDKLLDWLYFLEDPKSERVTKKMEENENLKEAVERLETLSEDEYLQRIADLREKAIRDEKAIYNKGLDVGIEQGTKKNKLEIAKKMLEEGMDVDIIVKITGMNENDKNLQKLLNEFDLEYIQRIKDLREKAIRDEKAIYNKGLDVGIEKNKLEMAKKMLEEGMDVDIIVKITGLPEEEILKTNM